MLLATAIALFVVNMPIKNPTKLLFKECTHSFMATPERIQKLIDAGADVNARGEDYKTPLMIAAYMNDNHKVIQTLLDAGTNVHSIDAKGDTALHIASLTNKNPAVVETILSAHANIDARDKKGWTPFMRAVWFNSNPEVAQTLMRHGAERYPKFDDGSTMLFVAVDNLFSKDMLAMLLRTSFEQEINKQNSKGETALMRAIVNRKPEMVIMLLNAGADPTLVWDRGYAKVTALELAKDKQSFQGNRGAFTINRTRIKINLASTSVTVSVT